MFDAKYVREHADEIRDTIKRQKKDDLLAVLDELLDQEQGWRELKGKSDELRKERNAVSESINKTKKEGGDIAPLLEKAKAIPAQLKEVEEQMRIYEEETLKPCLAQIPNIMHPDVPYGASDEENVQIKEWGEKRTDTVMNHVELCEKKGWADFEKSGETSGNGFYFLKGELGLLNRALLEFAVQKLVAKGYNYVEPPLMVRKRVLDAAMDTAGFDETIYKVEGEDLCMIGTAEHVILGMHEGEVLKEEELPKKYAGYSMCMRQEIGSHGINEKGLWRTHQFNKVEMFVFSLPEQSAEIYDELMGISEEILQELGLPYRVLEICTGDLALWKHRSHDLDIWRPTTQSYGEVMSLSNCTNYQAMDLGTRFVRKNGERGTVHTLNNTALATSRIMVGILEHYQNEDGTVTIPEVLRPFMGGKEKMGE